MDAEFTPTRGRGGPSGASTVLQRSPFEQPVAAPVGRGRGLWQRARRLFRRHRRSLFVLLVMAELAYIFFSVPLRLGFLFDPHATRDWHHGWTRDLTVLTALDLLADVAGVANFYEIFRAQRKAQAAMAAGASGPVGSRHHAAPGQISALEGRAGGGHGGGRHRRASLLGLAERRGSMLAVWSLNTLVPSMKLKQNIRRPLLLELISVLPLELLSIALGPNSLHVLRVHKLLRLYRVPECIREIKALHATSPLVQQLEFTGNSLLFKTVLRGMALCHWIACIYMAIAHFECGIDFLHCTKALSSGTSMTSSAHRRLSSGGYSSSTTTSDSTTSHIDTAHYTCWAIEDQLVGTSLGRQYGRAAYWSSRTLITLAYYDATPVTDLETAFAIVALVLGAVFSTSVLATFLFIFRYRNSRLQEFMANVDSAKEFMKSHHFPDDVREGVLSFYKNAWATHKGLYHGEVIERLPEHLSVSVYSVLKVQRIQNVVFLAKESIEFINTLAQKVELSVFSPKDWIVEKIADGMYFVLRGNVMLDAEGRAPRFAKAGDHFAEACLLYPGKADERARAQTFCELYKLPQRSFYSTLSIFYRSKASENLERMRSMLMRRDQQEQKMKRMLGRAPENFLESSDTLANLDGGGGNKQRRRRRWEMPGSNFRRSWEHMHLLLLAFVAFEVPLFVVFDSTSFPFGERSVISFQSLTSVLVEFFFMADFVFRARYFAYIDQLAMIPVTDPTYIFSAYKQNGMWLDLIAVIPVALVIEFAIHGALTYLASFRLLRLLRLRHIPQAIQEFAHIRGLSSKAQDALTLLLYVTLAIHVTGCVWFLLARFTLHNDEESLAHAESLTRSACLRDAGLYANCSWALFDAYGQIGTAFPTQDPSSIYTGKFAYLRSIYWSVVALTTIGYGDIVAFSTYETYFAMFWAFVGGIINYGVVGAMSNIISNLTASSRHHSEKINMINLVLEHFRVSENLRVHIRSFYHQQFYVQKVSSEAKLLAHLPTQLRHQISLVLHSESVQKVPLFVEMENPRLLHNLTGLFRRRIYQRGDTFFPESTMCDEMVVIVNGQANIFTKRAGSIPIGALTEGSCYGVCELLLRKPYTSSVVAASVVDVSVISYTAFSSTIERRFPAEVQTLRMRALQQHVFDTLTLEAIVDNIRTQPTVAKYTDKCVSMFVEKENWAHHVRKMQVRLYWDIILFLLDIHNAFQITFRICFLRDPSHALRLGLISVDFVGDFFLIMDVLLRLYYFECYGGLSNLLTREDRDELYAARGMKWDLWSCMPLYYVGNNFLAMSICRLPRLIRLRQVTEAVDSLIVRIQQRFSSGNISAYLGPLKLALVLVFAAHFAGCVFYLISVTDHNPNSWIQHDHIVHQEHASVGVLYLRSFYWALITLTLVGSREIVPLGVPGTVWATVTCLCCSFIVGHIVGELSDLILDLDRTKKELKEREDHFDQFAKDHSLPSSIRTRVLHYLHFQHSYLRGMDIYETFEDLSPNLRVQLMLDLHGDMIHNLSIAPFLNQTQIHGLAVRLRSELFIAGDTIVVEGNLGHKLYIVKCGTAMVLWKSTGTAVATLQAGSLFGEVAFFLRGQRRIATVQATTSCEMLVVNRRAWEEILALSQPDEAVATDQEMVKWVCGCLKSYNVMTVSIIKSIKVGDAVPPTIQELHTYNSTMRRQSSEWLAQKQYRAPQNLPGNVRVASKRDSAGTIQEKKMRHLLRKTALHKHGHANGKHDLSLSMRVWLYVQTIAISLWPRRLAPERTRIARVYASDGHDSDGSDDASNGALAKHELNGAGGGSSPKRMPGTGGGGYLVRAAHGFPMLGAKSFVHHTSTMQINPASTSMREYYGDGQLSEMEDECWRRYKVSLFLADSFLDQRIGSLSRVDVRNVGGPGAGQSSNQGRSAEDTGEPESSRRVVGRRIRVTRRTICGTLPGQNMDLGTRNSVTNDGMRWLANYETRNRSSMNSEARRAGADGDRYRSFTKSSYRPRHPSTVTAHRRSRMLKRSQSLPLFDRQYSSMVHAELQASSAKDHESKLNLGFELLQRCRQPEFSYLFQLYLTWLHKKRAWKESRMYSWLFGTSVRTSSSKSMRLRGAKSMRDLTLLQSPEVRSHVDEGGNDDDEADGASGPPGNSSKAETFLNLLTRYHRIWESLVVLVAVFYAVELPFLICFLNATETSHTTPSLRRWIGVVLFMDAFCLLDLALKYTAFQGVLRLEVGGDEDEDEHERRCCGVSMQTIIEVVAALPLELIVFLPGPDSTMHGYRWYYLSLLQLNKLTRIYDAGQASERLAQLLASDLNLSVDDSVLRFARSIGTYALAAHWLACIWFRISAYAYSVSDASWISTAGMLALSSFDSLDSVDVARRYVRALYFSVQSTTTTFYGDIASLNVLELVVEIVIILVCIFIFGALVGAQGERIEATYKRRMLFEAHLTALYHFLQSNEVPRAIRQRLRLYYTNTWLKYHGEDDQDGVAGLSTLLVEDIAQYSMRRFAAKVSILQSCDESFLRSLLTCLKHVICSANEAVVRKGDVDRSMYFIARGKVLVKGIGFELVKEEGDFFGELSLLYGIPRSATCSSLGVSLLYVLEWDTYERLLQDFPEYREQNRREWVIVSTVLKSGEPRFRAIVDIAAKMENADWVVVDDIIRKAKRLK